MSNMRYFVLNRNNNISNPKYSALKSAQIRVEKIESLAKLGVISYEAVGE